MWNKPWKYREGFANKYRASDYRSPIAGFYRAYGMVGIYVAS